MALIYKACDCYLIDHRDFITNVYKRTVVNENETVSFSLLSKLFSILNIAHKQSRKRQRNSDNLHEETMKVKAAYERFLQEIPADIKDSLVSKYKLLETSAVRDLSKELFESTIFDFMGMKGGNNAETSLKCRIKEHNFLIPPNSRFYCGCVKEQCLKLDGNKFDIVVADPPWWNKYIRRLKNANKKLSYSMMYNEDIAAIPLQNLLAENCLVAVWCTNAPSNVAAVKNIIFPKWGVEYVGTWYWMKVTVDVQPLCSFASGCEKQPYERIILGKIGEVNDIPDGQVVVSVPSALHSQKPPLLDILSPLVKTESPQTLELFARYLLPNTTSVGYEPLKWQHESLYEEVT
ncbi:N(6)-adenine-specific methyltransferase METTL4 isoform X1 [Spodoptera frugiperda]|uniref:N(6)-adenine-specific methyltransferase METTL4 isoform X1 n=2 Tax=Spodoptera frugiperda TaxID=7108 RepID=A0A9R0CZL8_SPOFR|nr:N(6)-adenine-specific methyltransferase METTL4 isoform X1 [Spodoptera frugiperda]